MHFECVICATCIKAHDCLALECGHIYHTDCITVLVQNVCENVHYVENVSFGIFINCKDTQRCIQTKP